MHIFKLPVRILAMKDMEGEKEHLELVFGKAENEGTRIRLNQEYGTMHATEKGEKLD